MAEVPPVTMDEHCTPSPFTSHGQKGIGEGGYMAAPAAVASAVNAALHQAGMRIDEVPMRPSRLWTLLQERGAVVGAR
jgi:2-furoyl-CoA dehydrogenase large subunit